jgi:hemolysin-activating ACP:hemolysin acyltransferase
MADSMVEFVARRLQMIAPSRYLTGNARPGGHIDWALMREEDQENYLLAARSLIKAMRIPTSAMKSSGDTLAPASILIWQAMIDAALAEP